MTRSNRTLARQWARSEPKMTADEMRAALDYLDRVDPSGRDSVIRALRSGDRVKRRDAVLRVKAALRGVRSSGSPGRIGP